MVLYVYMRMFVHSYFIKKFPDMILGDKPLISNVVLSQSTQGIDGEAIQQEEDKRGRQEE
jgi:hypothetical protein